jgi:hypothetical protein
MFAAGYAGVSEAFRCGGRRFLSVPVGVLESAIPPRVQVVGQGEPGGIERLARGSVRSSHPRLPS